MSNNRKKIWLTLIVVAIGLLPTAILGLWVFASATAEILHPNPQDVPVTGATPVQQWNGAAETAREIVRAHLAERNLPGLSVAVGAAGDIVWAEGFGFADIENKVPVAPNTRFRIGTASTALSSAAAGLLLEKGQLKLDDRIQAYVPEFPEKQWPVTLRQVMAHTAGLPNDGGDEGPLLATRCDRAVEALQAFGTRELRFEPGSEYRYSNYGWILVSAAIEAATGEPFAMFMRKQVFEPLGMNDTSADFSTEPVADQAKSYFPRFAGDPRYGPDPMRPLDYSCYAGSAAFSSTASDIVRFAMAMAGGKLLQPATIELLQASQRLSSGQETGYGLGWDLETVDLAGKQARLIGHDGELLGGIAVSFMTFPEQGITVAVLSNISYADTYTLATQVAQAFATNIKS